MKTILIFIFALTLLSGCKKDYYCNCTTIGTYGSISEHRILIPNTSRDNAVSECETHDEVSTSYTTDCELE